MPMKSIRLFCALAALSLLPLPLFADMAAPAKSAPERTGVYLTGKEPAFAQFPPAPKRNSEQDHIDLLITLTVQNSRTDAQIQEAWADQKYKDALIALTHIADPAFETTFPESGAVGGLVQRVSGDGGLILQQLKQKNARPRPYVQHPGLVLPLFPVRDFSYPSGHSAGAALQAELLADLFPKQAEALHAKADLIAASRVVAGVHYESDIEAGQDLGRLIYQTLKANPKFLADLQKARDEIAKTAAPTP